MKILKTKWFTEPGVLPQIGIVLGEDEITGELKARIGTGHVHRDETADAKKIAKQGAKFSVAAAKVLFGMDF